MDSAMRVSMEGIDRAFESAAKSMKRIAKGEIEIEDIQNLKQAEISTAANVKAIQTMSDMVDALLSVL
jgi:uncharacterized membrane-anchored protein